MKLLKDEQTIELTCPIQIRAFKNSGWYEQGKQEKSISQMNKAELLKLASEKGLNIADTATVSEIKAALEAAN